MVNSFERPHSSAFGAYSVTSHQRIQVLRLTRLPLQLFSSCIVASFVPHSRDYGGPRAAYDRCVGRISDLCKNENGSSPHF